MRHLTFFFGTKSLKSRVYFAAFATTLSSDGPISCAQWLQVPLWLLYVGGQCGFQQQSFHGFITGL